MKYSAYELALTIKNYVLTKLFFPKSRLVRYPIYIRNRRLMDFGEGLTTGYNCRFEVVDTIDNSKRLIFGNNISIGDNVHISASESVTIGDNCLLASKIYISDNSHGDYSNNNCASQPTNPPNDRPLFKKQVRIGNNVWIGENAVILPGVEIGNGCVVGANAFVNKKFGDNYIIAGVPAKAIKRFCEIEEKWVKI